MALVLLLALLGIKSGEFPFIKQQLFTFGSDELKYLFLPKEAAAV